MSPHPPRERPRPAFAGWIAAGVASLAVSTACRGDAPPPGVTDVVIESPREHHVREGFVQLVPPVHLPSSSPDRDQVEIWVKVPQGSTIALALDDAGRPTLEFPPGTLADRVEWMGKGDMRRIVDIRGTRIEADGSQTFYVYRPSAPDPRAPLFGLEWARGDASVQEAATEHLVARVAAHPPVAQMPAARREAVLEGVRVRNGCAACHPLSRPENQAPRQHGLVDRGTDRSGFFTPQTVLWDEVPLEAYGAHDRSWHDPSIEVRCGGEIVAAPEGEVPRRCSDGTIARGRMRWDVAEPAARAHRAAVCDGRRWLAAHMTQADGAKLSSALRPCEKI
ncbi:hypothetical protein [Paraliomyxa miuraensis]|uniref:hypothetical protein n=1 Tax=Paraliomyxa miuraensis TaxID=376150 RepID=UPI00225A5064|nr:hypothetical protein [Paraliomyxa miuraensis]MCX4244995.1 hypothetical protein [Paraliomyxa miuraensis]